MTVNFSLWKGITDGQTYGIPDSGNLHTHFDATVHSTLLFDESQVNDQDSIDEWQTLVGSEDLTGGSPIRNDNQIGGNTVVTFDTDDDTMQAQTASNWSFLHDGSPFAWYLVVNADDVSDGAYYGTTMGVSTSNNIGFVFWRDEREVADELKLFIGDGSGSFLFRIELSGEFPTNSDEIYAVTTDGSDYNLYRGKDNIATETGVSGHSTSNPEYPYELGSPSDSSFPGAGDHGENAIYDVHHDENTVFDVVDFLSDKWGISV